MEPKENSHSEGAAATFRTFSAARLKRSAGFRRLTGVSVATFDAMLRHLRGKWDEAQAGKQKFGRP